MKKLYVIRHCEAQGQEAEAPLTELGMQQADMLAEFLSTIHFDRIISSPFERSIQSISPFAKRTGITIETDERLTERVLSTEDLSDWLEKLEASFEEMELSFAGGESSLEATKRVVEVLEEIKMSEAETSVIVTHGNLLSLALKNYDENFGFVNWKKLSNPDIFLLQFDGGQEVVERVWNSEE
ncbi:histidine phosphatase family protein [Sporosarcina sp. BI001-red]|nr:histidine phosphatase family protein [Sporosarcina sp. BI001-red]REB07275.1 histidine phosphatase family protein [Sporosarcina sp. BI001-red]